MSPRRERAMVEPAEFRSYYGKPILKEPAWKQPDVPLYLFLGGAAGASATMAALADVTGRPRLARIGRLVASGGSVASVGALIHDLGRPERFLHMLRVLKPTSPLSVGSWILSPFSGLAAVAAASEVTGKLPVIGRLAGVGAGVLGPAMCTYTAVLLADTATPSWHEAHGTLPVLFAGSALTSGAGAALLAGETGPVVRAGLAGAAAELVAEHHLETGLGLASEPYRTGRAGKLLKAAKALTAAGAGLSLVAGRSRVAGALAGAAYLASGLCTRFGVYAAGVASTKDPKYVVVPQRERVSQRAGR
ncbi:NrfD/PsrC family molybdoenzyme membrane anchor subunit [Amycolatopsis nalaikhensis]|uniref:Polysulfide reductase NrfD n=1 Tax=Amycolatopsis nalaikhensis TaxID=715472 RepID=A0ABY8XGD4_9PSEU|nr:NrfD/PsrC family molybdoenzyme membrane anchor subunit [Amycolatopsis sp. 2-2]WIV54675.1 polysulfide reductase NrfD [Amycolatopsis sp. 2-2]